MNILAELFYGNNQSYKFEQSAEVRRKLSSMAAAEEKLKAKMPDDTLRGEVEQTFGKQTELIALCERDAYLAGFKLGVKLMIEIQGSE